MIKQLFAGFASEGPTDIRFLSKVIQRTFEDVVFEFTSQVEVYPIKEIKRGSGLFNDVVTQYARIADESGCIVLCVHADADAATDATVFQHKICPAFTHVRQSSSDVCKNLIAVVPVYMTESWMLADINVLKSQIGTNLSNIAIGLNLNPEFYSDPKLAIENALTFARAHVSKRRRKRLTISDLYSILGNKIPLESLNRLQSYRKFRTIVKEILIQLN